MSELHAKPLSSKNACRCRSGDSVDHGELEIKPANAYMRQQSRTGFNTVGVRFGVRQQALAVLHDIEASRGKRTSLQTNDREAAKQIVFAKNQAVKQPSINLQLAKAWT